MCVCSEHTGLSSVLHRGTPSRECRSCHSLHPLTEFEGEKRTCRKMLKKMREKKCCVVDDCCNPRPSMFKRMRVCSEHAGLSSVLHRGTPSRECRCCHSLHPLTEFEGEKRTCRKELEKLQKLRTAYKAHEALRIDRSRSRLLHDQVLRRIHEDTSILLRRAFLSSHEQLQDSSFEVSHVKFMFENFTNPYVRLTIAGEFSMIPGDMDFEKSSKTLVDFFWIVVLRSVYPMSDADVNAIFRGSKIDDEWFEAGGLDVSTLLERVRASWSDVYSRTPRCGTTKKRIVNDSREAKNYKCFKCGVAETPQWRQGPDGPGTLCNACGVRHLKNRV